MTLVSRGQLADLFFALQKDEALTCASRWNGALTAG